MNAEQDQIPSENLMRLKNFPISFFAMIMGLSGFAIAWEKAASVLETSWLTTVMGLISGLSLLAALGLFCFFAFVYSKKIMQFPQAVLAESKHPVKLSFFPAISISLILLSIGLYHYTSGVSLIFWLLGTSLHLVFTIYVISSWMHHEHYEVQHINPAWFIPAVGNVLVPIAGVMHGYMDVSWFFFSIGMMFWIILFTLLFNRVLFHNPLPTHLVPTFFILIAPPAVGFISYLKLQNGQLDAFANFLYYIGLFLTILLASQYKMFAKLPFFLSWWAYSFPIAAITIATFTLYGINHKGFYLFIGSLLLLVLTAVIALLLWNTLCAVKGKKICVEG